MRKRRQGRARCDCMSRCTFWARPARNRVPPDGPYLAGDLSDSHGYTRLRCGPAHDSRSESQKETARMTVADGVVSAEYQSSLHQTRDERHYHRAALADDTPTTITITALYDSTGEHEMRDTRATLLPITRTRRTTTRKYGTESTRQSPPNPLSRNVLVRRRDDPPSAARFVERTQSSQVSVS
ncbi:hypothetical protein CPLU01_09781 [Colletotrichum plurivorum]|uniref:Uncharacterized protein n=1 Tax=Colletotrichum plurivorum TaxID=2175906 RepID=A0A8H6K728_9PEZI|nr:hypothetical protein CPLU01_09781 [Colletotrichum plurivorum]